MRKHGRGLVRHIVIRIAKKTNEVMVTLVLNSNKFEKKQELVEYITKKHINIKTIIQNVNTQNTNVILGNKNIVLYGEGYIYDVLGEYKFKISPMSFYQVNPIQTEVLYKTAIKLANVNSNNVVFDLYCGIGTISIFMAKHVKQVYGIEVVEEAIKDARENAKMNNIGNANFYAGEVEVILPELLNRELPDIVIVDPPRKGLDNDTINHFLKIKAKKLVYISCNPSTMARDIALLNDVYNVEVVQPVDMFPWTSHVECVVVLELKQGK